ncbi:MAG: DUF6691 family protein [Bdellovibrionales bacterium]
MNHAGVAFFVGFLFSIGLGISGMTQPQKVMGFLDLASWDPTLLYVMIGAVGIHAITYPLVRRRGSPLLGGKWHVPDRKDIAPRLLIGAAIFGLGWGLAGYCPGPALTSLVSGDPRVMTFVVSMLAGMLLFMKIEDRIPLKK